MQDTVEKKKHSKIKYLKERVIYICVFLALVIVEILIALFVHDNFIRPYGGDIIIVGVIYCFIRILFPYRFTKLPFYVFVMALTVEIAQYFRYVELFGLANNKLMRTVLGTSFSVHDIICYGIGAVICLVIQFIVLRYKRGAKEKKKISE